MFKFNSRIQSYKLKLQISYPKAWFIKRWKFVSTCCRCLQSVPILNGFQMTTPWTNLLTSSWRTFSEIPCISGKASVNKQLCCALIMNWFSMITAWSNYVHSSGQGNQHIFGTFCLIFSLITIQSDIPRSVIHLSTGCEGMLLACQQSGNNVYCFDALNAMTEFYSINILWCPKQTAMKLNVDALFSKGLDI